MSEEHDSANIRSHLRNYFYSIPKIQREAFVLLTLLFLIIGVASLVKPEPKITKSAIIQNQTTTNLQPSQTPAPNSECEPTDNSSQKDFEFIAEHQITDEYESEKIPLMFNDTQYLKNKLGISEEVLQMHFLQERNQIVYLTGYDIFNQSDDHIRKVQLLDLENDSTQTLFSYQTAYKEYEANERKMYLDLAVLRSISVNEAQDKLGIITDQEIFVYDLDQKQFTFSHNGTTVEKEVFRDAENNRHFFNTLTFSPNDNYAVLSYGYYEGISYYLLNFNNRTITDLEKGGYGGGTFVEGWLGNQIVYINTDGGSPPSYNGSLCIQSVTLSNPTCIEMSVSSWADQVKTIGDKAYVLSRRSDMDKTFVSCNNVNNAFEFHPQFDSLMRYSFENQTETELLHKDTTRVSGFALDSEIINFVEYNLDGTPGLLLKLKLENESIVYAFLNPEVPEKLTKILL